MLDGREDQATGLRRLFRRAPPSVVAMFACGRDPRSLAAQMLLGMGRGAGRVAVLDEGRGETALAAQFGLVEQGDLLHVIDGRTRIRALVQHVSPDLCHLSVAGASLALPLLDEDNRERLIVALHDIHRHNQLIFVHGAATDVIEPSPFVLAAPRRLLLVEASASGVREGFATIKQLAACGAGDLSLVVAGARDQEEAKALFRQLEALVLERVGLPLRFLGEAGRDDIAGQLEDPMPPRRDHEAATAFLRRLAAWTRVRSVGNGAQA